MQSLERWLFKARQDIKTSEALLAIDLLDTAIYHTQQCAEKALKAYLVDHDALLEKTHDLSFLVQVCMKRDILFEILLSRASALKPFSTKFRYPDDLLLPEKEDVEKAILYAREILAFVEDKIKELNVGQKNIF